MPEASTISSYGRDNWFSAQIRLSPTGLAEAHYSPLSLSRCRALT